MCIPSSSTTTMLGLLLILFINHSLTKELPNTFKQCNRNDAEFSNCLKDAIGNAVHQLDHSKLEYGLVSFHPLFFTSLSIPAGHSAVQFSQNYKDLNVSGFEKVDCLNVEINLQDQPSLKLKLVSPEIIMDFNYEISGKLMVLPIHGTGPGEIKLEELSFTLDFFLERYKKADKSHFKVTKTALKLNPKFIVMRLDNLFGGEKTLSDNINKVLNDNWRDLFHEMKPKYEEAFSLKFETVFNDFLGFVSESELFGNN